MGWLAQQPPAFRDWVAVAGRWRRYQRDQVPYDAGDPSEGLYGLADGALDITLAEEPSAISVISGQGFPWTLSAG